MLRTNHGLWWRADPLLRRDVGAMLNKGEKVHDPTQAAIPRARVRRSLLLA
jgi:hypothetical protein